MAYGCQPSLDHAVAKIERASERIDSMTKADEARGFTTEERMLVHELVIAVGYLADAIRYLKAGVP